MIRITRREFGFLSASSLLAGSLAGSGGAHAQQVLKVGLIPSEDSRAMLAQSKDILDAVEKNSGLKVQGFVATDYNGVIEALRSGKLDVAYLGPFSYVLASQIANAEAFAIPVTKKTGKPTYQSIIITRQDKGLDSVARLQGKTFAFVDPSSASGHLFPKAGLKGEGVDIDRYFSRVIFSGSHDASILAVANGKVDAAAVADPIFDNAVAKGHVKAEDFRIIWRSQPIPESPMAWRKSLDATTKQKVATALAEIKGLPWGDRGELNGFASTNDQAYDVVRATAKTLNLDLGKMK